MRRILCPTDFSDASTSGIAYAAKLAKKLGAELTLFNVVALTHLLPEEMLMGEKVNVDPVKARLETQSMEVAQVFKISCSSEAQSTISSVTDVIASKALGFDLVVMGTNGIDEFSQFILGSKTYQAMRKLQKPIIMVPQDTLYCEPEAILYAYDYWKNKDVPLAQILSFSKLVECRNIIVLLVMEEPISAEAEEELAQYQFSLKKLYQAEINLTFETIFSTNTIEAIDTYMKENENYLLALYSEHHSFAASWFHKSIIKSIAGSAHFPVLVFHS